ncbi:MAG: hypothetical protein NT124_02940 [Candidatus Dependentiae bacterium]|nr:hypothetical protein [Candidatus Dependentiae bacterium]
MFISKSGLSRMLAVVMVSATLMSAVPAQAGAKDVAKKVAKFTYNAGKAGMLGMLLFSAYQEITKEVPNPTGAAAATFLAIVCGESIYNSYKNSFKKTKPSCDKEVTTAQATVAAKK